MFSVEKRFSAVIDQYSRTDNLFKVRLPGTSSEKKVYVSEMKVCIHFVGKCMVVEALATAYDPERKGIKIQGECLYGSKDIHTDKISVFEYQDYVLVSGIINEEITGQSAEMIIGNLFMKYCRDFIKKYFPLWDGFLEKHNV